MSKLEGEIPEVMFETETDNFVRDYETRLRQSGLDLNTYFKYTGLTIEALREQMRPQAERQVKVRLALEKIASLENLTATEEETNEEFQKISDTYNVPVEQVKAMIAVADLNADIVVGKALKLVRENAKIGAPKAKRTTKKAAAKAEETTEEAPKAKKTTTKKTTTKKATKADAE
jgi:trigger factor